MRRLIEILSVVAIGVGCATIAVHACGCSPYATAYRVTLTAAMARNSADDWIAGAFDARRETCHKQTAVSYEKCVQDSAEYKAIKQWRETWRGAITSAVSASANAIRLAELAKAKAEWQIMLKPAACAFVALGDVAAQIAKAAGKPAPDSLTAAIASGKELCK